MEREPKQFGDYRVLGLLGRGGMGEVYLARSPRSDLVAVKVMHGYLTGSAEYRARFRREVEAASRVGGGYTAAVLDADPDPRKGRPWLVTRYLPGFSLRHAVALAERAGTPLPADTVRSLAAGLAAGLAAIHDADVVHRDLKPDNVVVTSGGPRVIDFGIARPSEATPLTVPGRLPHNGPYMAPEQRAGQPASPAADVFALGGVLLFAVTGQDPFGTGATVVEPDLAAFTDPVVRRAVAACLRAEPARRPTASELTDLIGRPRLPLTGTGWLPKAIAEPIELLATAPDRIPEIIAPTVAQVRYGVEELPTDADTAPRWRRRALLGGAAVGIVGTAAGAWWRLDRPARRGTGSRTPPAHQESPAPPAAAQRWSAAVATGYPDLDTDGDLVLAWSPDALRALDARTGQPRWHRAAQGGSTGGAAIASGVSALRGPVGGGLAFLLDSAAYPFAVTAVRTGNGAVLWQYTLGSYPHPAPVLAGAALCLPADGLLALDTTGGGSRWQVSGDAQYGLTAGAGLVVAAGASALAAFDASTGAQRWRYALAKGSDPVVADTIVAALDGAGTVHAVTAGGGTPVWQREINAMGAMRYGAGVLYATSGDGTTYGLRAGTGVPVWSRRIGGGEGQAYGRANVLGLDGGTLYVAGTDRTVYALDGGTGKVRWTYAAQAALSSPPVAAAGLVFVGTADGAVHALAPAGATR